MPPADDEKEPVSVVIPIHNAATILDAAVGIWQGTLAKLGRESELILVDDGSTDRTAELAAKLTHGRGAVRLLRHETPRGFGACLRTAFAATRYPLVFYTSLNYPYTPADLGKLLERIAEVDPVLQRRLDLVSGCRTGRPIPAVWQLLGWLYRTVARVAFGLRLEPLPGWLGFREHLRSWVAWVVFGVPLVDVNSAFKLLRRSLLDRFPIQSDGDFVHAELIAKATFTTSLMDELPLTPNPTPVPRTEWSEFGKILREAQFTPPARPEPAVPVPDSQPAPS